MIVTPAEALASVARPPAARGRRTLTELAQGFLRWLDAHHRPQTTIASYGDGLGAFLTFATAVGMVYPDQVTVVSLDGYYVWLRSRGKSANTMAHRRSVLIAFWKWLEHEGFAERNVPAKTYPIKTPRRLPIYLEPHQIDDFLAKLGALTHLAGQGDHAVVATFFYSGVRVSELASLRVADVDLVAGRIRVNQGKGGKDRIVYVPPRLQPILARYLANVRPRLVGRLVRGAVPPDVGWLFVNAHPASAHRLNPRGQSLLSRSWYWVIRHRASTLLGVKLSPHKPRHTCATYLLYHGAQLETIQRVLGHSDVQTTMIYLHTPRSGKKKRAGGSSDDEATGGHRAVPRGKGRCVMATPRRSDRLGLLLWVNTAARLRARLRAERGVAREEMTVRPEDTLRAAGISTKRQAKYQRRMSSLLAGREGR